MADLDAPHAIPATTQLIAIAWMRWRMFANGFRRNQVERGKIAGLVLMILLRLLLWPIFALMALGPALGAGFLAWDAVGKHHPSGLIFLFTGLALLWQFVAINGTSLASQMSSFDPASLLRFPLRFGRYFVLRVALGFLTPSTLIGCLALLAAAIGIAVANLSLLPVALPILAVYAAMNIFIARTVAIWMERWLATRRAREIFGALMAVIFVSVQFFNFRTTGPHHHANRTRLLLYLASFHHALNWLPPGFAGNAILAAEYPLLRLAQFAGLLAWTALFFATFAFRLHKQFLGEYLSEGAPRSAPATPSPRSLPARAAAPATSARTLLSPPLAACLRKEWVYLRGNGSQLVSMLTPLIFVFLLSRGVLAHHPAFLLSGSVGYALFGLLAGLYNVFGADAAGVQLYLLAPVRLRDVLLAKNIASSAMLTVEAVLAWVVVRLISTAPIPLPTQIAAFFWIAFVILVNLTLGNWSSIASPRKVTLGQARAIRPSSSNRTTALLVIAVLLGSILLEVPVTLLCSHFHTLWLAVWIFAPLAAGAAAAYAILLDQADRLILTHRDLFAEALCGT